MSGYDIIADVHGHGDELRTLLTELGYGRAPGGSWGHPDRKAIFVGDLCDRGPDQLGVYRLVRAMVDDGNAEVGSGNHEANARAFFHLRHDGKHHLRKRSEANRHQHEVFLAAVGEDTPLHREVVDWFATMPLWIDKGDFKVVHACWDPASMGVLSPHVDDTNALSLDGLHLAYTRGTHEFAALETVLKGVEVHLPIGKHFLDSDGNKRKRARTRWWDPSATTFKAAAIVPDDMVSGLPDEVLPIGLELTDTGDKPIFCGHYWLTGTPYLTSERVAVLDFSVARHGVLCSYRWDGEPTLSADKLHWVGRGSKLNR